MQDLNNYIQVNDSFVRHYKDVDLYYRAANGNYILYKPAGAKISDVRLGNGSFPILFIEEKDKKKAAIEIQQIFNKKLEKEIKGGNISEVKEILVTLVGDALEDPRSGKLETMPSTMEILIQQYVGQSENLKSLASLSFKDYTTTIHSINVMALVISYCFGVGYSMEETLNMGLGALYHDLGKTRISSDILTAPRKLNDNEFAIMKTHTSLGFEIIEDSNLDNECLKCAILEHHEKLDGSGYPNKISTISDCGQIIGIIDAYEALTNESRPYRDAMKPIDALHMIKEDVDKGKFSKTFFEKFAYSLL